MLPPLLGPAKEPALTILVSFPVQGMLSRSINNFFFLSLRTAFKGETMPDADTAKEPDSRAASAAEGGPGEELGGGMLAARETVSVPGR